MQLLKYFVFSFYLKVIEHWPHTLLLENDRKGIEPEISALITFQYI